MENRYLTASLAAFQKRLAMQLPAAQPGDLDRSDRGEAKSWGSGPAPCRERATGVNRPRAGATGVVAGGSGGGNSKGDETMTRKQLDKQVDAILEQICEGRNLNPATGAKGGQRETAHALLGLAIDKLQRSLLHWSGVPGNDDFAGIGPIVRPVAIADESAAA